MAEVVIPNVDCDGVLTGTPNSPPSVFRPFDCVKTLTHEQVKAGWRESFSAKEGRSYFYNVITRESVWIIPTITKPVQREQRRMVDSTPSDILAAAVDELVASPIESYGTKKDSPSFRMVIKIILTKIVANEILRFTYYEQTQRACEGCEENWASQAEHECLFFGVPPECRLYDYVDEHYEKVKESVQVDTVLDILCVMISFLRITESSEEDPNSMIQDILNGWKEDPEDVARLFHSAVFDDLSKLIDSTIKQLNEYNRSLC